MTTATLTWQPVERAFWQTPLCSIITDSLEIVFPVNENRTTWHSAKQTFYNVHTRSTRRKRYASMWTCMYIVIHVCDNDQVCLRLAFCIATNLFFTQHKATTGWEVLKAFKKTPSLKSHLIICLSSELEYTCKISLLYMKSNGIIASNSIMTHSE